VIEAGDEAQERGLAADPTAGQREELLVAYVDDTASRA
jgi:hypothetical protein